MRRDQVNFLISHRLIQKFSVNCNKAIEIQIQNFTCHLLHPDNLTNYPLALGLVYMEKVNPPCRVKSANSPRRSRAEVCKKEGNIHNIRLSDLDSRHFR